MSEGEKNNVESRRSTLKRLAGYLMGGGLVAAYGNLAAVMARYLYPARPTERGFLFVTDLASLGAGESLLYTTPSGATVNVTRRGAGDTVEDFLALSSGCPHLGCQVHWEPQNVRYFCPCHNGVFTPEGVAIDGPPADADSSVSVSAEDRERAPVHRSRHPAPGGARNVNAVVAWLKDRLPLDVDSLRELTNEPVPHHLKRW
jgi:nitrite reductase/ring-hydroxylating ferredoxin subunit